MSKHRLLPFGLAALAALVLTAVGFVATGAAAPQAPFKAGLVSDVGRFNDRGFNQNQLTGLKRAQKELKVQIRAVESRSAGDYLPNMASLARQGFGIVIVGRVPAGRRDERGRPAVPEHQVRDHRLLGHGCALQG